jgi:TPR repeat protein
VPSDTPLHCTWRTVGPFAALGLGVQMDSTQFEKTLEQYRENAHKTTDPNVRLHFCKFLFQLSSSDAPSADSAFDLTPASSGVVGTTYAQANARPAPPIALSEATRTKLRVEAIDILKKLAKSSIARDLVIQAESQYLLAECYRKSAKLNSSMGRDTEEAWRLYESSSKKNHPGSNYRAGWCCEYGEGRKKELKRAVQYYAKAARLNDAAGWFWPRDS